MCDAAFWHHVYGVYSIFIITEISFTDQPLSVGTLIILAANSDLVLVFRTTHHLVLVIFSHLNSFSLSLFLVSSLSLSG